MNMPVPYSLDLRWRIVWLHVCGRRPADIARTLCISERTVRRYLARFHQNGEVKPLAHRNVPHRLLDTYEQLQILRMISDTPSLYLHEIKQKLFDMFGVNLSVSTICRALKSIGCSRQVITHVALQQSEEIRARFMAKISSYDPGTLIWIDESGHDKRKSLRKFGYSLQGVRPVERRLLIRGVRYSAIPIMTIDGLHDVYIAEGTINGERFSHFVEAYLLPLLLPYNGVNPFSVVVMDNASIHHVDSVVNLIEGRGSHLVFLPPYSPDLNPIELVFGKVKSILQENGDHFQTCSTPTTFLTSAFGLVTKEDCLNYSKHCGYL